jgi:heme o synthase
MRRFLGLLGELNKVRITVAVTLTTLAGYTLAHKQIDTAVILPLIGIFILACGSAALNQYQERDRDILMKRTMNRPIPAGKLSPTAALAIAIAEILIGTFIVYIGSNAEAAIVGFLAFVWYNLIYTPLKRKTAFAVIPGSVIGALPPVVGWLAGGGSITDPKLLVLAFFFFMTQVPHFWLLMLKYGQEYVDAGYPSVTTTFTQKQIKRVTFVWTVASALVVLLMIYSDLITTLFFKVMVLLASVWLIYIFTKLFKKISVTLNPFYYFMRLNYFVLSVILALIIGPLI